MIKRSYIKYFNKLFRKEIFYGYKNGLGETGGHCYRQRIGQIHTPKIAKYFSKDELIEETIDGLEVYAIKAKTLIERSIELG
jgi:aminoglycoside 3-N-acetyltransferase